MSTNLREWNRYTSQTLAERSAALAPAIDVGAAATPGNFIRRVIAANVDGINLRNSPASIRRREFIVGGGSATPNRPQDDEESSTDVPDLRGIHPDNCFDPSILPNAYPSESPESMHAQLFLNVGVGHQVNVRLSQNGVFSGDGKWSRGIRIIATAGPISTPPILFLWLAPSPPALLVRRHQPRLICPTCPRTRHASPSMPMLQCTLPQDPLSPLVRTSMVAALLYERP